MIYSFNEWLSDRQINENKQNTDLPVSPRLGEFVRKPEEVNWYFIDNPSSLLNALMSGENVDPMQYSIFKIKDIGPEDGLLGQRVTTASHTIGKEKEVRPGSLREISHGIAKKNKNDRYFIHVDGTTGGRREAVKRNIAVQNVLDKYRQYLNLEVPPTTPTIPNHDQIEKPYQNDLPVPPVPSYDQTESPKDAQSFNPEIGQQNVPRFQLQGREVIQQNPEPIHHQQWKYHNDKRHYPGI